MCFGKYVRFFCPQALARHLLCPDTHPNGGSIMPYATMWVQTKWVCCGSHRSDCLECPALQNPGHIEIQDACALECDDCGARLRWERAEEMAEMGGLDEGEDSDEMVTETETETEVETDVEMDSDMYVEVDPEMEEDEEEEDEEYMDVECDCQGCQEDREDPESDFQCDCAKCRSMR